MTHQQVIPLLREAEQQGYFGSIDLRYENGAIVVVKRSETLKPADFLWDNGEVSSEQHFTR